MVFRHADLPKDPVFQLRNVGACGPAKRIGRSMGHRFPEPCSEGRGSGTGALFSGSQGVIFSSRTFDNNTQSMRFTVVFQEFLQKWDIPTLGCKGRGSRKSKSCAGGTGPGHEDPFHDLAASSLPVRKVPVEVAAAPDFIKPQLPPGRQLTQRSLSRAQFRGPSATANCLTVSKTD